MSNSTSKVAAEFACIETSRSLNFRAARDAGLGSRPTIRDPRLDFLSAISQNDTSGSRFGVSRSFLYFDTSNIDRDVSAAKLNLVAKQAGTTRIVAFLEDERRRAGGYRDSDFLRIQGYRPGVPMDNRYVASSTILDTSTFTGTLIPFSLELGALARQRIKKNDAIGIVICAKVDVDFDLSSPPAAGTGVFSFVSPGTRTHTSDVPTLDILIEPNRSIDSRGGGRRTKRAGRLLQGKALMGMEEDDL